jgi:hypothetical protein
MSRSSWPSALQPWLRPQVVGRIGTHGCAHRVELNISIAVQQIGVAIYQGRFVASFPERSGAVVAVVDVADVSPPQRLHEAGDLSAAGRRHQQVDVIGHQYIGMHGTAFTQRDLLEILQVALAVHVSEKAGLAVIAALDHMLRDTWEVKAWPAWHRRLLAKDLSVPVSACGFCQRRSKGLLGKVDSDPGFGPRFRFRDGCSNGNFR